MINTDNYELYFFQYQEGVLDESARREVEAFMALHPELAEEMALYAEAPVLPPEEVAFPFKDSLHRKESPVLWWRCAAAAAVVVGVAATLWLALPQQPEAPQLAMNLAKPVGGAAYEVRRSEPKFAAFSAVAKPATTSPSMSAAVPQEEELHAAAIDDDGRLASETFEELPVAEIGESGDPKEPVLLAVAETSQDIVIEVTGLVTYKTKSQTQPRPKPQTDLLGNPIREDMPLLAMSF